MQNFFLANLTGEEIETLMQSLGELPAKHTRVLMNKIEGQVVTQLQAQAKGKPDQVADTGTLEP